MLALWSISYELRYGYKLFMVLLFYCPLSFQRVCITIVFVVSFHSGRFIFNSLIISSFLTQSIREHHLVLPKNFLSADYIRWLWVYDNKNKLLFLTHENCLYNLRSFEISLFTCFCSLVSYLLQLFSFYGQSPSMLCGTLKLRIVLCASFLKCSCRNVI